jgi:hypothetical protein
MTFYTLLAHHYGYPRLLLICPCGRRRFGVMGELEDKDE